MRNLMQGGSPAPLSGHWAAGHMQPQRKTPAIESASQVCAWRKTSSSFGSTPLDSILLAIWLRSEYLSMVKRLDHTLNLRVDLTNAPLPRRVVSYVRLRRHALDEQLGAKFHSAQPDAMHQTQVIERSRSRLPGCGFRCCIV